MTGHDSGEQRVAYANVKASLQTQVSHGSEIQTDTRLIGLH